MAITLKKIAEEAGTSVATVSMVLRDYPVRCSAETAKKIKEIARKNNYVPNYAAVSLIKQKTDTIGVIVPDIENLFFAGLVKQWNRMFSKDGYTLILLSQSDGSAGAKLEQIETLRRKNVDAMILALSLGEESKERDRIAEEINRLDVPHVIVDAYSAQVRCGCIATDHSLGAELAADYLIANGHRKIGCITGGEKEYSAVRRYEGFLKSMKKHGVPLSDGMTYQGDYSFESGYRCAKELLTKDVTAVFAFNDMMAYGAMKAAAEIGKKIPEEVSLIGYDDILFSSMTYIPLTTVRQPMEEISGRVYREIKGLLSREISEEESCMQNIKPELVIRASVRDLNV